MFRYNFSVASLLVVLASSLFPSLCSARTYMKKETSQVIIEDRSFERSIPELHNDYFAMMMDRDDNKELEEQKEHRKLQLYNDLVASESQGPWEKCLGMQAEDCVDYVESVAPDVYCVIVYPKDFEFNRIWIRVNHADEVIRAPSRG